MGDTVVIYVWAKTLQESLMFIGSCDGHMTAGWIQHFSNIFNTVTAIVKMEALRTWNLHPSPFKQLLNTSVSCESPEVKDMKMRFACV